MTTKTGLAARLRQRADELDAVERQERAQAAARKGVMSLAYGALHLLDTIDLHVGPPDALYLRNQHIVSPNPCAAHVRFSLHSAMPPIR